MSLTVLTTKDEQLAGQAFITMAREGAGRGGLLVLVPTFAEVLRVQKRLANEGVGLGVEVTTPNSWVRDRWDVWGDGRRVVDGSSRVLVMTEALRKAQQNSSVPLAQTSGTVKLLCSLAQRALPWKDAALKQYGELLAPAELSAMSVLNTYNDLLESQGLVEGATCACELCATLERAGVKLPHTVFLGFGDLGKDVRELLMGLAMRGEVTLVARMANTLSCEQTLQMVKQVEGEAKGLGIEVLHALDDVVSSANRTSELDALTRGLFKKMDSKLEPTGAVRLLLPSGPLAEAELVAREVGALAQKGCRSVLVVVPDVRRAWRELVPKLVAHDMSVKAQLSLPPLKTETGRSFLGYVRTVAQLVELGKTWPAPRAGVDGECVQVGDMSWWPPQDLVDFLLCDVSHTSPAKARNLDVYWRSDRLLAPAGVLAQLQSARLTSDPVERATRELLRGRLGSAASKLLQPYVEKGMGVSSNVQGHRTSLAREEATAVLASFLSVASTLHELGITADPAASTSVSLLELVNKAELALGTARVVLRPQICVENERAHVVLVGRGGAAAFEPASFDAAVLCGLTSVDFAVPTGEGELEGMLCDLAIEPKADPLPAQRALFSKLCALPTQELLLERPLFGADAKETYPAVMLNELLSCYASELASSKLPEDHARANLAAAGVSPVQMDQETVAPAGRIDDELRRLVLVPQEGQAELPGGLPVLSASQLESYLECPLKWFSLRRLRLGDNDAGFGPLEMGTFAHRVLELTYAQLYEEGRAKLDVRDVDGMAHAHAVLDEQFRIHSEHQHMRAGNKGVYQALIAHSSQEKSALERLQRDLGSTLEYAAARFEGYEPRAFEWEFGRGRSKEEQGGLPSVPEATYAGVRVTGTVDRIDINGQGQAVIIDYKHKGPTGFFGEYAAFGTSGPDSDEFVLPRRIQALLYAQVVRRAFADVRVVGALYLGTRGSHELSGVVDEAQSDAIYGGTLGPRRAKQVVVGRQESFGQADACGMDALLDATEQAIAHKVERLREGHIEAEPIDAAACKYCPVANCERRMQ